MILWGSMGGMLWFISTYIPKACILTSKTLQRWLHIETLILPVDWSINDFIDKCDDGRWSMFGKDMSLKCDLESGISIFLLECLSLLPACGAISKSLPPHPFAMLLCLETFELLTENIYKLQAKIHISFFKIVRVKYCVSLVWK